MINSENDKIDRLENVFIVVVIFFFFDDVISMFGKCWYFVLMCLINMFGDVGCRRGDIICYCLNVRNYYLIFSCLCKIEVEKLGVMLVVFIIKFFFINVCVLKV